MLIGELAVLGVQGTFASYTGEMTNPSSAASTGTLTLSTTLGAVTCESYGGSVGTPVANKNANCGSLISAGGFTPGQSTTQTFTVANTGSLRANALSIYAPSSCTSSGSSADLCDAVELYVEETSNASGGSPIRCFYPVAASGACSFATYSTPGGTGTLTDFATNEYTDIYDTLGLTGGLGPASNRFITFGFELPSFSSPTTGNQYQGGTATFPLTWLLSQSST